MNLDSRRTSTLHQEFRWFFNSFRLSLVNRNCILEIMKVHPADGGKYIIELKSEVGDVITDATLTVTVRGENRHMCFVYKKLQITYMFSLRSGQQNL